LKSIESFREEVERALALGVDYVVLHRAARGARARLTHRNVRAQFESCDQGLRLDRVRILLENTAGQGECIGHRFEHLRAIMDRCPKLKLGVCVDTAHSFTAGYDIREEDGLEAMIEIIRRTVGLRNVRAVHFNDSRRAVQFTRRSSLAHWRRTHRSRSPAPLCATSETCACGFHS